MTRQSSENAKYVVKVGNEADQRLHILNNIFRPTTMGFLHKLGLQPGMRVLEVGCGTGHVTIDIANAVGPSGHVTAIDISPEQIAVADNNIKQTGLTNVTLKAMNTNDLHELGEQFHFVCSRFILMHLEEPGRALTAMWSCVMAGGILACEEPEMSKCYSAEASEAFDRSMRWHLSYAKYAGLDFDIGLKLLPQFESLGFTNPAEWCTQPTVKGKQKEKQIYPMLHAECKDKYVQAGLAKPQEVDDTVEELLALVNRPTTLFGCAMQHQVWAKKDPATKKPDAEYRPALRSKL